MNKALNEIGKLRNEMKVGFIKLENQMKAGNESLQNQVGSLQNQIKLFQKEMKRSVESTIRTIEKFSQKVETGFIAVESALDKDLGTEISQIKKRLDDANI